MIKEQQLYVRCWLNDQLQLPFIFIFLYELWRNIYIKGIKKNTKCIHVWFQLNPQPQRSSIYVCYMSNSLTLLNHKDYCTYTVLKSTFIEQCNIVSVLCSNGKYDMIAVKNLTI